MDFNKQVCITYSKNIGNHNICADISDISSKSIPDCNLIIGGSPCQGFSNANRMTNYLDNPKNFLIKEFVRVVKDKMPEVFILENVPQFISCGNGQFLKEVELQLEQYEIEYKILNAVSFGVPQDRKRAIVIGSRIGRIYHPETCVTEFKTVREAFQGLNNDVPNQKDYSRARKDTLERIKCVPQGGNFKNIPETLRTKGQHSDFYKRLKWDEPSITIANPRKAVIIHPEEDRILSIRECARIQSFPDDYIFYGTLADKQQQVADAVPPLLSEAIAKQIKKYIEIGIGYKNSITA